MYLPFLIFLVVVSEKDLVKDVVASIHDSKQLSIVKWC